MQENKDEIKRCQILMFPILSRRYSLNLRHPTRCRKLILCVLFNSIRNCWIISPNPTFKLDNLPSRCHFNRRDWSPVARDLKLERENLVYIQILLRSLQVSSFIIYYLLYSRCFQDCLCLDGIDSCSD